MHKLQYHLPLASMEVNSARLVVMRVLGSCKKSNSLDGSTKFGWREDEGCAMVVEVVGKKDSSHFFGMICAYHVPKHRFCFRLSDIT